MEFFMMRIKSLIFALIGLWVLAIGIIPSQPTFAGANDVNVQWAELYHKAPSANARTEFVPGQSYTFFSVDNSGNYYPSTQARVSILVDNNDITSANVVYWDGVADVYVPMSYQTDVTANLNFTGDNQYSIWSGVLPTPSLLGISAGQNFCYRIQVNDGADNDYLNGTSGDWQNPIGQWVVDNDISSNNFCEGVQAFPTISLLTGTDAQGENVTTRNIPINISSAINEPITVNISYADGTATTSDNDYNTTTTSFTIPANTSGSYGAPITGFINNDNKYELNDSFTITLTSVATGNASISLGSTIIYTLINDDPVPTVSWATTTASQTEGNSGTAGYFLTVSLSNPSYQNIMVDVNYADLGATYLTDYGLSNTVTIVAGSTTNTTYTYIIYGDTLDEPNEDFSLTLGTVSGGTATIGASDTITITILDNDSAGYDLDSSGVTAISEPNTTTSFTIRLTSSPSGPVTMAFESDDATECALSPTSFVFDNTNWNNLQTITITAQDDLIADGAQTCNVSARLVGGTPSEYLVVPNPVFPVTVNDNETAGYDLNISGVTAISEPNTTTSFTIRLTSLPSSPVTMAFESDDATECALSPTSFVFDNTNWNNIQTITIIAQDDLIVDGAQTCNVSARLVGGTPSEYLVVPNPVFPVTVNDNEIAGYTVNTGGVTAISEPNTTTSFTFGLNTTPSGTVIINFTSTDPTECQPSPTSYTFTDTTPQTITITAQDDALLDGAQPCGITILYAGGTASEYSALANPADVNTTVNDDESPNGLSASAVCVGNNLQVTIGAGDANFNVTGTGGGGLPLTNVGLGAYTLTGPSTWTVTVTELSGDTETLNLGTFTCPVPVVVPPVTSAPPPVPQRCDVGGYSLEIPEGIFCTDLFANGRILIPGSIPANLASRTIEAVDIGTFNGRTVVSGEFGTGLPICLGGVGQLIFLDASTSPRAQFGLNTFTIDGKTCGFIINSGTVVLITP